MNLPAVSNEPGALILCIVTEDTQRETLGGFGDDELNYSNRYMTSPSALQSPTPLPISSSVEEATLKRKHHDELLGSHSITRYLKLLRQA